MRKIAFIGLMAAACASSPKEITYPKTDGTKPKTETVETVPCRKQKAVTRCLVEEARKDCEDESCLDKKLTADYEYPGEEKHYSFVIEKGDEVFSIIVGDHEYANLVGVATLNVDEKGVKFGYLNADLVEYDLGKANITEESSFRVNYDGSTEGEIWKIEPIVWNFSIKRDEKDVFVSFSTKFNINTRQEKPYSDMGTTDQ